VDNAMAKRTKERLGLPRRYTFKMAPTAQQEAVLVEHCRIINRLRNGCIQRNEDAYRRLANAKYEMWWRPYNPPRKRRDGTIIDGRYVKRHLAYADRLHADPEARKLTGAEKIAVFGTEKTVLGLFDLTPEITAARREESAWQEMSKFSLLRVAKTVEEAFNAFFKRAKAGAGEQSGYPRYRATAKADWLPAMFASGCKLTRSQGSSTKKWRLYLKGVPGTISVSGEFPGVPLAWLDADVRLRDGSWWLSVCVELAPRRTASAGGEPATVALNLIDKFAETKGDIPNPPSWGDVMAMQEQVDALKVERDTRFPWKRGTRPSRNWQKMTGRIGKLSARIARVRRERLHEWTTETVVRCGSLTVVAPPVKTHTRTAKGTEQAWGAAVDAVAEINRHVLSQAPASAVAMLEYKAKEAGIRCDVITDEAPATTIGAALADAGRELRRASRKVRKGDHNADRNRQNPSHHREGDGPARPVG
jgi:hypothetical protein